VPHFTTIASFVSKNSSEIEALFEQILLVCHEPVLESIEARFKRLGISDNIYATGTVVTTDTGFANAKNMKYVHENNINAYIPDNRFRSRDPKFAKQKEKYGKRHQEKKKKHSVHGKKVISASEFSFDPVNLICICPAGETISHRGVREDMYGNPKAMFEGRLMQCRNCDIKFVFYIDSS